MEMRLETHHIYDSNIDAFPYESLLVCELAVDTG